MAMNTDLGTIIEGLRSMHSTPESLRKEHIDMELITMMKEPRRFPFLSQLWLQEGQNKKTVGTVDGKFEWVVDYRVPHATTVIGEITGGSTTATLNLSNIQTLDYFKVNDKLLIEETGEEGVVTAKSDTEITISRVNGSVFTTTTETGNVTVARLGGYLKEDDEFKLSPTINKEVKYNYTTIHTDALGMTDEEISVSKARGTKTEETFESYLNKVIFNHKESIERSLLFTKESNAWTDTGGDGRVHIGKGLLGQIVTNQFTYSTITQTAIEDWLYEVLPHSENNHRMLLCGYNVYRDIQAAARDWFTPVQTNAMQISKIVTGFKEYEVPFGSMTIVHHPLMDDSHKNTAMLVDPKLLQLYYRAPDDKGARSFRLEGDLQDNNSTRKMVGMLTEVGLAVYHEDNHAIITKV